MEFLISDALLHSERTLAGWGLGIRAGVKGVCEGGLKTCS